jgi:hypothetical protein
MQRNKEALGYHTKVAQDRQRIANMMLRVPAPVKAAWDKTKTTRRIPVDEATELLAWDSATGAVLYGVVFVRGSFDLQKGLTIIAVKTNHATNVATSAIEIGRDPVQVSEDVFMCVDMVDPFTYVKGQLHLNVVVYSGASPSGKWEKGTVVGTKNEII